MNARELRKAMAAADPVDRALLERLDFEAMEADLLADADGGLPPLPGLEPERPRRHRRRLVLGTASAALAVVVAAVLILAGGGSDRPARAYGADLVRFAEASPLLLLEGPGWHVQKVTEHRYREGIYGQMEFVTGKPVPGEPITIHGGSGHESESGMLPPAVRQRVVRLQWRPETLPDAIAEQRSYPHPRGHHWRKLPVLETMAYVDTRAEFFLDAGGPGDREMRAFWEEDGDTIELEAAVPDLAAFEERLAWLTKVDQQTWLEAMPPQVVKAADHDAVVREILKGIPLPKTFALGRIPDEGLNTSREQVTGQATDTVACLWLRQWGEAQRTDDSSSEAEAERALASSPNWPILREESNGRPYDGLIWQIAMAMPQGYWEWHGHHRNLLAQAEGLGCARFGLPLLPEKMKRQREHGVPPPPP